MRQRGELKTPTPLVSTGQSARVAAEAACYVAHVQASGAYHVAVVGADYQLLVDGDDEAHDDAVRAAGNSYRVAVVLADSTRDVALVAAEHGYTHAVKGLGGADKARQNAVDQAVRNFTVAESNAYATKLVDLADAEADYRADDAASFAVAMADLAIDHPSPWANLAADVAAAKADLAADVAAAEAEKAAGEADANRDLEVAEANAELVKSNLKALATAIFNDAAADARLVLAEAEAAAKVLAAALGVLGPDAPGPLPSAGQQGEPSLRQKPGVATEGSYHQSPFAFSQQGCSADTHTWHPYDHYYQEYEEVDPFEHWYDYGGSAIFELLHAMGLDAEAYQTLIQTAAAPTPVSMPPGGPWKCAMSEGTSGTSSSSAQAPTAGPAATPTGGAIVPTAVSDDDQSRNDAAKRLQQLRKEHPAGFELDLPIVDPTVGQERPSPEALQKAFREEGYDGSTAKKWIKINARKYVQHVAHLVYEMLVRARNDGIESCKDLSTDDLKTIANAVAHAYVRAVYSFMDEHPLATPSRGWRPESLDQSMKDAWPVCSDFADYISSYMISELGDTFIELSMGERRVSDFVGVKRVQAVKSPNDQHNFVVIYPNGFDIASAVKNGECQANYLILDPWKNLLPEVYHPKLGEHDLPTHLGASISAPTSTERIRQWIDKHFDFDGFLSTLNSAMSRRTPPFGM